ncbi:MAG TPA: hypothetical protein VMH83_07120, partial [Candidatus Acidoferrum sp.]|nr:hypothetical protein [Candidatus Acidoferrum sp.]
MFPKTFRFSSTILLTLTLTACATNPTGGVNFVTMSEKRELDMGKEEHGKLLKTSPVYHNDKL